MANTWHYFVNQMDNCTKNSFKKAKKLSDYHDAALLRAKNDNPTDTDYATAYSRYHILHLAFVAAYILWQSKGGAQESGTLNIKQLMSLMTAKINRWWGQIIVIYAADTTRFKAIFPDLRNPFRVGSRNSRIAAVGTLSANIGADVALSATKTEVDAYYAQLNTANTGQTGDKTAVDTASAACEAARKAAMVGQFQNVGFFINKTPDNPSIYAHLWDVETITNPAQTIWKGHLDVNENHQVFIHTFTPGDDLRLKCVGVTSTDKIVFYLASTPGGTDSDPVTVLINHQQTINVTAFNVTDYSTHRYLTVINQSTGETRFMVQMY